MPIVQGAARRACTLKSPSVAGLARHRRAAPRNEPGRGVQGQVEGAEERPQGARLQPSEQEKRRGARRDRLHRPRATRPSSRLVQTLRQSRACRARLPTRRRHSNHSSQGLCPCTPGSPTVRHRPHRHTRQAWGTRYPITPRAPVRVASRRACTRPRPLRRPCPSRRSLRAGTPTTIRSTTRSSRSSTASRVRASARTRRRERIVCARVGLLGAVAGVGAAAAHEVSEWRSRWRRGQTLTAPSLAASLPGPAQDAFISHGLRRYRVALTARHAPARLPIPRHRPRSHPYLRRGPCSELLPPARVSPPRTSMLC